MYVGFEETNVTLEKIKDFTLEKKIDFKKNIKKKIILMVMIMISHIEPPFYTSLTRVYEAWTQGFWAHGFSCGMHKTMGLEHGFVHMVLYGCFPISFEYEKKST